MKETPWFTGDQKPARVGSYERQYKSGIVFYSWWDGMRFGLGMSSPAQSFGGSVMPSTDQNLPWRGIFK